ncbi:MAG: VOC family protein [Bacteroidota bacterium]
MIRYAHTNIITEDWQTLADFYINTFDCKVKPPARDQSGEWLSQGTGVSNAHLTGVHLLLPGHGPNGPTLEIYTYKSIIPQGAVVPNQRGIGHLAFEVEDVSTVLNKVIANGGSKNGEVISRPVQGVGVITFVYARDPDGNLIELQHWEKE